MILTVATDSADGTRAVGRVLASCARPGDVILLAGDLGAGKTELVKGFASGLGVGDETPVTSPTYTLLNRYTGRLSLYHFDLYRLPAGEAGALGLDEYFYGEGVSLVEWPERLAADRPENCLTVDISVTGDTSRRIEIGHSGEGDAACMEELHECLKKVLTVVSIPAKHSFSTAVQDDEKEED